MRALQQFLRWIGCGEAPTLRQRLIVANRKRDLALATYAAAKLVGDTRAISSSYADYRAATDEALRAEMAYRASAGRHGHLAAQRASAKVGSR